MATLRGTAESLWVELSPRCPGLSVEVQAEADSTNTLALARPRAGDTAPVLLVAEQQTAGRGRMGRPWVAAPGSALTFSLALPLAPKDWSGLSLAVGVALAEALHKSVHLKWPNDLWLLDAQGQPSKLGGILIETATLAGEGLRRWVVIGVGLNVTAVPDIPSLPDNAVPPAMVRQWWPQADPALVLARVAPVLLDAVLQFEQEGLAPFRERYLQRDALAGRAVQVRASDGLVLQGRAEGIDGQGGLRLQAADGWHTVTSAEVSVRPC